MDKFILLLVITVISVTGQQDQQSAITGENRTLYRVILRTQRDYEQVEAMVQLPRFNDVSKWRIGNTHVDLMIPREKISNVLSYLESKGMNATLLDKRVKIMYSKPYNPNPSPALRWNGNYKTCNDFGRSVDYDNCAWTTCFTAFVTYGDACSSQYGQPDDGSGLYYPTNTPSNKGRNDDQSHCWFFSTQYRCCKCLP